MTLLFGHDDTVIPWLIERVEFAEPWPDAMSIGVIHDNYLVGAVVYYHHSEGDVRMAVAGEGNWLSRQALRAFFGHVFYEPPLGMAKRRATGIVLKRNKIARRFNERLGFKMEGVHREVFPDGSDSVSFGMLKKDCRWI